MELRCQTQSLTAAPKKASNNKCKFAEGEKVLCYEPDPAKTKVLYDSKVLKLVPEQDDQGRKIYKYLIHFQGWNSTWDRYVTEEYVLKDTEENRQLQKKLADEAQLTPGGHLYRRDRKRRHPRSGPRSVSSECSEESADETLDENEPVPNDVGTLLPLKRYPDLDFSEDLKFHVGYNCHLIHEDNYLVKLPCVPNIVTIFENYLKYFARTHCSNNTLPKKGRKQDVFDKTKIEKRYKICIEVLDGLRICFNTFCFTKLLINENEQVQFCEAIKMALEPPKVCVDVPPQQNGDHPDLQVNVPNGEDHVHGKQNYAQSVASIRSQKTTQTSQASQKTCSFSECSLSKSQCTKLFKETFYKARDEHVTKADLWKAVPDSLYYEECKQPAIIYGVNHLLRLLDLLPKILMYTNMNDEKKIAAIYSVCNGLLGYLSSQNHLFGTKHYMVSQMIKNDLTETVKKSEEPPKSKRSRRL